MRHNNDAKLAAIQKALEDLTREGSLITYRAVCRRSGVSFEFIKNHDSVHRKVVEAISKDATANMVQTVRTEEGRAQRRQAVITALAALQAEDLKMTFREVAARAGVSVRFVTYQEDLRSCIEAAMSDRIDRKKAAVRAERQAKRSGHRDRIAKRKREALQVALAELKASGSPISKTTVAQRARVGLQFLNRQGDILADVDRATGGRPQLRPPAAGWKVPRLVLAALEEMVQGDARITQESVATKAGVRARSIREHPDLVLLIREAEAKRQQRPKSYHGDPSD